MAYTTATLTGHYLTTSGEPAEGVVEIIPNSRQIVDPAGEVILSGRVKVALTDGAFTVTLPATDDATLEPATGRQYTIVAKLRHAHLAAVTGVELAGGSTVDVASVSSMPVVDAETTNAATTAQLQALEQSVAEGLAGKQDAGDYATTDAIPTTPDEVGAEPAGLSATTNAALAGTYVPQADIGQPGGVASYDDTRFAALPAPATTYYVNSVSGLDTNNGLTSGAAFKTLTKAITTIGNGNAVVKVHAPITTPLREQATFSGTGTVTVEPETPGAPWYCWGSYAIHNSGSWAAMGGGVYRFAGLGLDGMVVVTTMQETVGDAEYWLRLSKNTTTPTTPAAGQYGVSGADLYVHLPGDVSPTTHKVEVGQRLFPIRITAATGTLTLKFGRFAFARSGVVAITAGNATVYAEDCEASYAPPGASGWSPVTSGTMILTRCRAVRNDNDGFNVSGSGIMTLTDCEGAYNGDEGASPHQTSVMRVIRGTYHHNGYSGIAAVNNCTLIIEDTVLHDNHLSSAPASEGGLTLHETVTAHIFGMRVRDDAAAGVYAHNTTTVSRSGVVSGVAQGNALPDNWSATP